ncbi:hypothetical protein PV325_003343 [Microctonus aethiopoides]|uniref:Molybdate-anion transporter n=1 Tax=Microctonus aethiopoides TaxID=144406 RepID=A0AA39FQD3_9HYME|nr:hypothetical protein PV325_003343 [Microctonus aethiopoides]KAK0173897.1 hypothetical protein PV328_007035 [Microctonus aethiopoides]
MNKLIVPEKSQEKIYQELKRNYLIVFLMANFADWLQGPYLYKVYSNYGYEKKDISFFYITGFMSSAISGIFIGHYADKFGRKRLCLFYFFATIFACLSILVENNFLLHIGRIFGGISNSILFSTFESWYISQHLLQYNISKDLIGHTMADSTFYNSLLAIIAGFVTSLLVDNYELGPKSPFIFTIPISIISAILCKIFWIENITMEVYTSPLKGLALIFEKKNGLMIHLGIIQMFFETAMYIFIFLWTSILIPIDPSNGVIFGGFMLCIVIGSICHSFSVNIFQVTREILLLCSLILALFSMITSTIGIHIQTQAQKNIIGTYICLISFLLFEISVGLYFPAIGYLRGIIIPESHRTSIVNWYRLPSNILTCFILLYITIESPDTCSIFALGAMGLIIAVLYAIKFNKIYLHNNHSMNVNRLCSSTYT